jgi:hypothetical protein
MNILVKNEINLIVNSIIEFYQISIDDIDKRKNKNKKPDVIWPRQVVEYYLYKDRNYQLSDISEITGASRCTIFNSVKIVSNEIDTKSIKGLSVIELMRNIDMLMNLYKEGIKLSSYMTEKFLNIKTLINSIQTQINEYNVLRGVFDEFKTKCNNLL